MRSEPQLFVSMLAKQPGRARVLIGQSPAVPMSEFVNTKCCVAYSSSITLIEPLCKDPVDDAGQGACSTTRGNQLAQLRRHGQYLVPAGHESSWQPAAGTAQVAKVATPTQCST